MTNPNPSPELRARSFPWRACDRCEQSEQCKADSRTCADQAQFSSQTPPPRSLSTDVQSAATGLHEHDGSLNVAMPAVGEVMELECEYDPDGSYALIWKNGYAITAFPNGKVAITKSNRENGFYPFGCDVSELTTRATVAAGDDEGNWVNHERIRQEAQASGYQQAIEAAAKVVDAMTDAEDEASAFLALDAARAAIRLLSQGGGK
jgi:hypothetical protein